MSTAIVILITPGFTADEADQNCQPTLQLFVAELLRQNVVVRIVALDYPFSDTPYQWKGASVYPCGGRNSRWRKPRTLWRAIQICHRLLDEAPRDAANAPVLHSFWLGWASGIGERVARQRGVRHVTTLMGQDARTQNRHRFRFLSPQRQHRLVVLSEFQNEALERNAGYRAQHVVPWGVAVSEIPAAFTGNRPVDVLGVGSFIPLKNWDKWLKTIALAAKKRPGIQAELIGAGPEKDRLVELAGHLGIGQNVRFAGYLPRPQVLERMRNARLLLHTSDYESQGYVLSEAAMNGCRIVATPVGIAPLMGACASTAEDLAVLVTTALEAPALTSAVTPFIMPDTVAAYLELYTVIKVICMILLMVNI